MLELMPLNQAEEMIERLFDRIVAVAKGIPKEGFLSKGKVFEWTNLKITSNYLL